MLALLRPTFIGVFSVSFRVLPSLSCRVLSTFQLFSSRGFTTRVTNPKPSWRPNDWGVHDCIKMNATLHFSLLLEQCDPQEHPVLIIGQLKYLNKLAFDDVKIKLEARVSQEEIQSEGIQESINPNMAQCVWSLANDGRGIAKTVKTFTQAVAALHPSPTDSCSMWLNNATVAALPSKCSRHNTPSRSHSITKIVKSCLTGGGGYIVIVCERSEVFASGCAVARALPLYSNKSSTSSSTKRKVTVEFLLVGADKERALTEADLECISTVSSGIRLTAKLVDMPCAELHTDSFIEEILKIGQELQITPTIIQGEELKEKGFGGLYGVGKAAVHQPALAVLSHTPESATKTIAWVGKGIVYDTGGLSIKPKTGMIGMKRDCGGAAAILGAFSAAVKLGFKENLHAVFCLAENAVGPEAVRPDDILTLYSGRTVEINNTDAEGRLVLGDGVAYANKDLKADIVIDIATLTGAQGVSTGRYHAGIVTNNEDWEMACVKAGQNSGDLVHPLPYSPELHFSEFASALADMKNSVSDRSNAQVSCAGLFIAAHLGFDYPGIWIHIDIASPVHTGERATGYGVALLTTLFGQSMSNQLLEGIAPMTICDGENNEENSAKKIRLI